MIATFPELMSCRQEEVDEWSKVLRAVSIALNSAREKSISPEFGNPEPPEIVEDVTDFARWSFTMETKGDFTSKSYPTKQNCIAVLQYHFEREVWKHYYHWNGSY